MSVFAKYRCAVISKAEYDSEGVGYSTVQEDFPYLPGPGVAYGKTLSEIQTAVDSDGKAWWVGHKEDITVGRVKDPDDPHNKQNLWVKAGANDLFAQTLAQDGVDGTTGYATPTLGTVPAACIVIATVTNAATLAAIDGAAKHFVLGIDNPDLNGDELPASLLPYDWDATFPPARWTELRNALVSLGLDSEVIDGWHDNNPDATPRDFGEAFKKFIG